MWAFKKLDFLPTILYISYDGMTDPLGQSQVIPYLQGLSNAGYTIHLLSCEKQGRLEKLGTDIRKILLRGNISWHYTLFTQKPPVLAKLYDLYKLKQKAKKLHAKHNFSMVHCRSYVAADVGLMLKKKYGIKFLFDMRGFWVDERVDGGLWQLSNPLYKWAYGKYKKKEADYISNADAIVSLTTAGKKEIETWKHYKGNLLSVIPCSADYELFSLATPEEKTHARLKLGINTDTLVVSYLGSIGTWYLLDNMLLFFKQLKQHVPNSQFLFITNGEHALITNKAEEAGLSLKDIILFSAQRSEVPVYAKASDFSISFIKACYSKISSSPTKLGELLAMGIPVVCNTGVGDVEEIINYTQGGLLVHDFERESFQHVIDKIELLKKSEAASIREKAKKYYDLANARNMYSELYKKILSA